LITMPATSIRGFKYILTIICMHTRYGIAVSLKKQLTEDVWSAVNDNVVLVHGAPKVILSDNGRNLHNTMYKALCHQLGIEPKYIMPYRSNANGAVERLNGSLKRLLWFFCEQAPSKWHEWLKYAVASYNHSVHSVTGFAPYTLLTGAQPRAFFTDMPSFSVTPFNMDKKAQTRLEFVEKAREIARDNVIKATDNRAISANKTRQPRQFSVGEECYVLQLTRPTGLANFYWCPYDGPYVVIGKRQPDVYILRRHDWTAQKSINIHVERMKPFCRLSTEPQFALTPGLEDESRDSESTLDLALDPNEAQDDGDEQAIVNEEEASDGESTSEQAQISNNLQVNGDMQDVINEDDVGQS